MGVKKGVKDRVAYPRIAVLPSRIACLITVIHSIHNVRALTKKKIYTENWCAHSNWQVMRQLSIAGATINSNRQEQQKVFPKRE
jgi:hypothetical protein